MRTLFLILFLFITGFKVSGQNISEKVFKNAISVNLTTPLINAINKNKLDSATLRLATNIAVSRIIGKKILLRAGIGGYNNYQSIASDLYIDRKIENVNKLTALLSIYRLTSITDNWLFGIGLSLSGVYNHTEKLSDSGFDILKSYEYSKGGGAGPAFLFQYNLNKRLALVSEYSILYNTYNTAYGKEFSSYPEQNYARSKALNQGVQFQFPLAIYINYQF